MFPYYGSKALLAEYYPKPKFNKIIEPFAGAARYSLHHWQKDVLLCDKYEVVARIWKWLIEQASKQDIMSLPDIGKGDTIKREDFDCDEQFWLMGFFCQTSASAPGQTVTEFSDGTIPQRKKFVAENLHKVKHWKIVEGVYYNLPNEEATYYIDPPYQYGGEHYVKNNKVIDFRYLSKWCKSRNGQIIVAENTKANWLPFKPLRKLNGTVHKTTEAIWSNLPIPMDNIQTKLDLNF
jgi:hypothetical protein